MTLISHSNGSIFSIHLSDPPQNELLNPFPGQNWIILRQSRKFWVRIPQPCSKDRSSGAKKPLFGIIDILSYGWLDGSETDGDDDTPSGRYRLAGRCHRLKLNVMSTLHSKAIDSMNPQMKREFN